MLNTITHFENGIPIETWHGVISWINRQDGSFWFETRQNGKIIAFWGDTIYWCVSNCPMTTGRITVCEHL